MFANDLLVCGAATKQEVEAILQILNHFCSLSGQVPNWAKSGIMFTANVDLQLRQEIKGLFPVPDIDVSFIHLGHPLVFPDKDRSAAYSFVYDKFKSKLTTYKANRTSHPARLTLIKYVFSSIPVYYMSNILFSKKFLASITAIIRRFWWTGIKDDNTSTYLCLRAWADICTDNKSGGLGIRNLQALNQSLILSTAWRIAQNPTSNLALILKSMYHADTSIWRANSSCPKFAFWTAILKVKPLLESACFTQIVDGSSSIWSTPWFNRWQNIYNNLVIQHPPFNYPATIKDLWIPNRKAWNHDLVNSLLTPHVATTILNTPIIDDVGQDMLVWKLTPAGKFSTKSAYRHCFKNLQLPRNQMPKQVPQRVINLLNQVWAEKHMIPKV